MTLQPVSREALSTERQLALFGCDLVDLLRREGRHSGVWFADSLLKAADVIERGVFSQPVDEALVERIRREAFLDAIIAAQAAPFDTRSGAVEAIRETAALTKPASIGDVERLREAAQTVLKHRVGDLPSQGWLRDNDRSRKALADLAAVLASLSPVVGEEG